MPRGVPKAGFRKTRKSKVADQVQPFVLPARMEEITSNETDAEIEQKLETRFRILSLMAKGCTDESIRSLIVSGPAGLGKSFEVEKTLQNWDPSEDNWTIVKGYVRPTSLFRLFWQNRQPGKILVFDDADAIFGDETSLNLLKAACDSSDVRRISYMTETQLLDDGDEEMPKTFVFEGTVIFITNYDFDGMIEKGHRLSPHFQALVSRSHYVDLAMKTKRDYMIRIKQVSRTGLLDEVGLSIDESEDVILFIESNMDRMRELSLRMALKVAAVRKLGANWEEIARVTCLRNQ